MELAYSKHHSAMTSSIRPQKINFNKSLLYHSLNKSQANLSNRSLHKKSCSSLLSQLNVFIYQHQMTYSRLTLATKYDLVKEDTSMQEQIQYEFQEEDSIQNEEFIRQKNMCSDCLLMKQRLSQIQSFLLEIQKKIVQKQILLADRYKTITDQLYHKNQELQKCRNHCKQFQQQIQSLKVTQFLPKLQLNTTTKAFNSISLPSQTSQNYLNTVQSTKDSQKQITKNILKQSICLSKSLQTDKQNSPIRKNTEINESAKKSLISSVDLSYTESERQMTTESDPFKYLGNNRNVQTYVNTNTKKTEPDEDFRTSRDYELSKLRFENSSLKSYNSVLLEHAKPKSLAEKIFVFHKN